MYSLQQLKQLFSNPKIIRFFLVTAGRGSARQTISFSLNGQTLRGFCIDQINGSAIAMYTDSGQWLLKSVVNTESLQVCPKRFLQIAKVAPIAKKATISYAILNYSFDVYSDGILAERVSRSLQLDPLTSGVIDFSGSYTNLFIKDAVKSPFPNLLTQEVAKITANLSGADGLQINDCSVNAIGVFANIIFTFADNAEKNYTLSLYGCPESVGPGNIGSFLNIEWNIAEV